MFKNYFNKLKDGKILKKSSVLFFIYFFTAICTFLMIYLNTYFRESLGILILLLALDIIFLITATNGYFYTCIKSFSEKKELPYINLKRDFVLSFKMLIAGGLFGFVLGIAFLILKIIGELFKLFGLVKLYGVIMLLFITIFILIFCFLLPAFNYIFARKKLFTVFFQLKTVINYLKKDFKTYFKYTSLYWAITIIIGLFNTLLPTPENIIDNYSAILLESLFMAFISTCGIYLTSFAVANSITHEEEQEKNN